MKKHRGTSWDKIKDLRNLPFFYTLKNYDGYIKIIKDIRSGVAFDLKLTVR